MVKNRYNSLAKKMKNAKGAALMAWEDELLIAMRKIGSKKPTLKHHAETPSFPVEAATEKED
jgi:hypothetical protein